MGGWRRAGVAVVGLLVAAGFGSVRWSEGRQEPEAQTRNTEIVGHVAPKQDGGYGDVWAHRDVAYLGSLRQGDCQPPNGVWSIDLSDPAKPRPLA